MNPFRLLTRRLATDPHITELRGKSHRLSHSNGLFEASFTLSPQDRDEFERRSKLIEDELRTKLDIVAATHDEAVSKAKATARVAHEEARATAEAAKWSLFGDFFKLPTQEQIAASETPVNHVVRMPTVAGPDTAGAVPQGAV